MQIICVSLIFVSSQGQVYQQNFDVPQGTTIRALLALSGWFNPVICDELQAVATWLSHTLDHTPPNHKQWYVGIFSQKKALGHHLKAGERVEIYRPLTLSPMAKRKTKAAHKHKSTP